MRRGVAQVIFAVVYLAGYVVGVWLILQHEPSHRTLAGKIAGVLLVLAATLFGVVVHELGHALAVRLAGGRVRAIRLFSPPALLTFHIGKLTVSFGLRLRGQVEYPGGLSVARDAVVTAAGPAAEALTAPLWLLFPIPRWLALFLTLISLTSGLRDYAPGDDGYDSDGYKLFRFPARLRAEADICKLFATPDWTYLPDAGDRLVNGYRLEVRQAEDYVGELSAEPDMLLRLYAQPWTLPKRPERDALRAVHDMSWRVLLIPDVPTELADLAADRIDWAIENIDEDDDDANERRVNFKHTLAVARLRQARPRQVRALCEDALARDDLSARLRATVLATLAMANHARMLSGEAELDEALALDPSADLVAEAVALLRGGQVDADSRRPREASSDDGAPEVALHAG
jgi:hypothetical protein